MMRRGMLLIIMLPNGDLRIVLHLVPFWILTIWGSVHIEETVVAGVSQWAQIFYIFTLLLWSGYLARVIYLKTEFCINVFYR